MYDRSSAAAVFSGLLDEELIPPGYLRKFVEDNVSWLRGEKLEPAMRGGTALPSMHRGTCLLAWPFRPWETSSNCR